MKNIDSNTVTAVIAVIAIVSPVLTAIINNLFQLIIKILETKEKHQQDTVKYQRCVFEDYLRYTSQHVNNRANSLKDKYKEVYSLALLYAPDAISTQMIEIDNLASNDYRNDANQKLTQLIPQIKKYLSKL